jgi:hypothetical protein
MMECAVAAIKGKNALENVLSALDNERIHYIKCKNEG